MMVMIMIDKKKFRFDVCGDFDNGVIERSIARTG
jgi:hypothetical protein